MSAYTTTRGAPPAPLETSLFSGLGPDGGLYVPERLPTLAWPPRLSAAAVGGDVVPADHDLRPVARWAASRLFPSVGSDRLERVVDRALVFPVPLVEVEPGRWVLELFHGPTHAFKDVGARFMAELLAELSPRPATRTVLVATSGDTGGAVASAFLGRDDWRVVTLYPRRGVSELQRRQMTTLGGNVHPFAVDGTFDDCQRLAKAAFGDAALSRRYALTSANSINLARLLPQTFYYLHAARLLRVAARYFVPAGNLGNLCAGLMAARSGMPSAGFTAATNENRGFVDYLEGTPFAPRPSVPTTSSAMDVGNPSNLERIRWLMGDDDQAVRDAISGAWVDMSAVRRCITSLYERTGYVLDPHTAVAYEAAVRHSGPIDGPAVVLATAHPAKFPDVVDEAIGRPVAVPDGFPDPAAPERMKTIEPDLGALAAALEEIDP